jgi:hypothetical protein
MFRLSPGAADQINATVADMCGAAIEVPLIDWYEPSFQDDRTSTPGAEMFGLIVPPSGDGPRLEKLAMALLMSNAPTA